MFDVIWGDPDRELVGEHRAKKELKKETQKEKEKKRGSLSTARSSRSSSDSPLAFLRSHGLKRIATSDANASTRSTGSSQIASPSASICSPLSPTFDFTSRPNSDIAATRTSSDPSFVDRQSEIDCTGAKGPEAVKTSPGLSRHDSVFSTYEESDTESPNLITKRLGRHRPNAPVTSPGVEPLPLSIRRKEKRRGVNLSTTDKTGESGVGFSSPTASENKALRTALEEQNCVQIECLISSSNSGISYSRSHTPSGQPNRLNNPNMWQKPHERSSSLPKQSSPRREQKKPREVSTSNKLSPLALHILSGVESWNQHVARLHNLTNEQLLTEFTNFSSKNPCVPSHEETGINLRLTMLWALDHLDPIFGATRPGRHAAAISPQKGASHLAFYETQETVAYLAASSPRCNISHMAPSPLTDKFSANIRPLSTQSQRSEDFSNDIESFDTVSCLRLPSICSRADVPNMLKRIALSLKLGGTLQLTLIDPLPLAATLGPRMRSWLENNLMTNLEKNQRCKDPRKAFPSWLAHANLRGHGSSVTTTRFYAIPKCVANSRNRLIKESGLPIDKTHQEKFIKAEIRSHIGRSLWAEVWGPFVTASKWWWDDPICVEECTELNTIWNYYQIESRKG